MKDSSSHQSSSSSSSSCLVFWALVPLILVTGIVFLASPKTTNWASLSYNTQRVSNSSFAGSDGDDDGDGDGDGDRIASLPSPSPSPFLSSSDVNTTHEENEKHLGLQQRVVGGPQIQEALSDDDGGDGDSIFNQSPSPTIEIHEPEELKDSVNESTAPPPVTIEKKQHSKLEQLEAGLVRVRAAIKEAAKNGSNLPDPNYVPQGPMYRNSHAFHRSYLEMEKHFKVFIYEEGEPPLFHNGPCKSIYSTEGNFIHMMEVEERMRTQDPETAHVYFLPFSITMMVHYVYVPNSHDFGPIKRTVIDYVDAVSRKYPYWNRSLGADHFMLACHDWGPEASRVIPDMHKNSIRVLCNANTSEGFIPSKDVSFPEINLVTGDIKGYVGGPSPSKRPVLAFFAGGLHGPVRPILLEHWENKDNDIQVHKYLPKGVSYHGMVKNSRFCLCPSGYEVASPRIVEALYGGCVPVLISDHYVPPFSDVLNWKAFSVEVPVSEIPNLKNILMSISSRQYIRMQRRGVQVRKHFELNLPPKRFDMFYMILHSIWLRRLNVRIHD